MKICMWFLVMTLLFAGAAQAKDTDKHNQLERMLDVTAQRNSPLKGEKIKQLKVMLFADELDEAIKKIGGKQNVLLQKLVQKVASISLDIGGSLNNLCKNIGSVKNQDEIDKDATYIKENLPNFTQNKVYKNFVARKLVDQMNAYGTKLEKIASNENTLFYFGWLVVSTCFNDVIDDQKIDNITGRLGELIFLEKKGS